MLRPVIMIGCGGSGQKAVRYIRDAVRRHLDHAGWQGDFPRSWQFIGLDTLNVQESPGEIPTMPGSDYLSVALGFNNFQALENALLAQHSPQSSGYKELIGWRPVASQVQVPLLDGAGQMRAVGRTAGIVSLANVVRPKLQEAFVECTAGGPELQQVSEKLGIPVPPGTTTPEPIVVVLGSMAGGTGAGIMLDVLDLVRRTDTSGGFPVAVIFTPDIFNFKQNDAMSANGLALMSELMSAYWDNQLSGSELIPALVPVNNRGPHATFLVGRKNLGGIDLESSINVYRAVGEAIASWVTSAGVQEQIWNFITVNWPSYAQTNMGGYPFGEVYQPGVISSFGSSTLSIGRDRFRDYAKKLLMRELLENLYEGHLRRAPAELGKEADNLTESAILRTLVDRNRQNFLADCGIAQDGGQSNQITDQFASADLAKKELAEVKKELHAPFGGQQWAPTDWLRSLTSQANISRKQSSGRAVSGFDHEVVAWGPKAFEQILRVTSMYVGKYGLKMAGALVREAQNELIRDSGVVKEKSADEEKKSLAMLEEAKSTLLNAGSGEIGFESAPVVAACDNFAKAVARDWRATRYDRTADAMEALAMNVLGPLAGHLDQAHGHVYEMVTSIAGEEALIETWPQHRGGIPQLFLPSPLEFFLEDVDTWPGTLEDLTSDAMEIVLEDDNAAVDYQPSNSVDATRYLLNVGDFAATENSRVPPIVWATTFGSGNPQWSPGGNPQIEIEVSHEDIEKRVNAWMNRPATKMARTLNEGLRGYLAPIDSNGQPVANHTERLRTFQQKLNEAKNQSQPLIEIDTALNSVTHPANNGRLTTLPLVQGFPFRVGDPARELVTQIFDQAGVGDAFSDRETESVLISSFIEYPVHPMVVSSFTQPLARVIQGIGGNPALTRGAFWLWRRTKVLEDFVPLPDEVRKSIIRGFAVARMLGYITADPSQPITISTESGPLQFPFPLLTNVSQDNILPALLEAFALCYADVATQGRASFDPYRHLFDLGDGTGHLYNLTGDAKTFIKTGKLRLPAVDRERYESAQGATEQERSNNLEQYLEDNATRFRRLQTHPFSGQENRDMFGSVHPEDTLSIELIQDLIDSYEEVSNAITTGSSGGVV